FGIALAATTAGGERMTQTGMSLGTPHYMSPEQAMGEREITARSDVYALGAMTYEMLTGDPPFTGSTAQAIVAKAMTEKPAPPSRHRDTVPEAVEDAVLTALARLPADRFGSAAEFATALGATASGTVAPHRSARHPARPPARQSARSAALAATLLATAALATWGWLRPHAPDSDAPPSRLALLAPGLGGAVTGLQRQLALTPDGSTLLYSNMVDGQLLTVRHPLDADAGQVLAGVPSALAGYVISTDGQEFIGYVAGGQSFYRFPVAGGNGVALPREVGNPNLAWASDGAIWFGGTQDVDRGMGRLGADNVVTRPFGARNANLVPLEILPGDRTMLVISRPFGASAGPLQLLDLQSGETEPLLNVDVVMARISAGHLVYALTSGTLEAVPIDLERRKLLGRAVTIATGVSLSGTGVAQFDVAANGTVAYIPEAERSLVLIDRAGGIRPAVPERHNFHSPRFSPDGRRIAVDFTTIDGRDVWLAELASGAVTRATFNRDGHDASWGPDGRFLTYITAPEGVIGIRRITPGSTEPAESLLAAPNLAYTGIWLGDGSALVTAASALAPGSRADIGIVRNAGRGPIEPLVATRFDELYPAVSPDGRWIAYVSNQSGRYEVYARALDGQGAQVQVSVDGGVEPMWGPSGREIFYRGGKETAPELMLATVTSGPDRVVTARHALFGVAEMATSSPHANYDVSPDGSTFVMVRNNPSTRIMVIQNLPALVAKLRGQVATTP
ncbi:MAG: protein kinase, partial [Gemmatimonadales bacterium]|nr:protein kinase [Gemmatimonadales bacterium]